MDITNFDQWLDTLGQALGRAKTMGMPNELVKKSAVNIGDFLADKVNPDIPENRLLRNLWEVASDEEREAIASTMVKLVDQRKKAH